MTSHVAQRAVVEGVKQGIVGKFMHFLKVLPSPYISIEDFIIAAKSSREVLSIGCMIQ